jgi:hypothetical protein
MRQMAVCGLFMAVWTSMVQSRRYHDALSLHGGNFQVAYESKYGSWSTAANGDWVLLTVELPERFGVWRFGISTSYLGVFIQEWGSDSNAEMERKPQFDDKTFEAMFGALKQACRTYIQYNQLTVRKRNQPLLEVLFDS